MSFVPVIAITDVARDSASVTVVDTTGDYPASATGYGVPGGPADAAAITKLWGLIQLYNSPDATSASIQGDLGEEIKVIGSVPDGVDTISLLYGEPLSTLDYTIDEARTLITIDDGGLVALFEGVWGVSLSVNMFPLQIKAISDTTIELYSAIPDDIPDDGTGIYRVYKADAKILAMNQAQSKLCCMVLALPMEGNDCTDLYEVMELESVILVAREEFLRQNYSRASEAIRLAIGLVSTQTCTDCV